MKHLQNKSKALLKIFAIMITLLANKVIVYSQVSDSFKNELQKVSLTMYECHDRNFVIVDAIIDGFIKPYDRYSFSYQNGIVIINNYRLDDVTNMVYSNKIKNFFSRNHMSTQNGFSMTNNATISPKDIFNPSSRFRTENKPVNPAIQNKYDQITNMLIADKLIDTLLIYTIKYDPQGLYISNKKVDELIGFKYVTFINNLFGPAQTSLGFMINKGHAILLGY